MKGSSFTAVHHALSLWDQRARGAHWLHLVGPAGTGKSWAARRVRDVACAPSNTAPLISEPPLLTQLLYQSAHLFQQLHDETFVAAARLFAPPQHTNVPWSRPSLQTHTQNDLHTLRSAVVSAFMRSVQAAGGMIVVCEDLHGWTQDDQEALLSLWTHADGQQAPLLLMTTSRSSIPWAVNAAAKGPETLELTSLSAEDFPAFCRAALYSESLPKGLSEWLFQHSEGHPLHANEMLHLLLDSGALRHAGSTWAFTPPDVGEVPEGLKQVLLHRLYSVQDSPHLWRALCALAIVERAIDRSRLAHLTGDLPERVRYTLQRARRAALVRSEQRQDTPVYSLSHPLYPELIQSFLTEAQFQALHLRAMGVAQSDSQRAFHARLAGHPEAARLTRQAAESALARVAFAEAVQNFEALMQLGERSDEVRFHCGYSYLQLGQAQRAIEMLQDCNHPSAPRYRAEAFARLSHFQAGLQDMQRHPNPGPLWHPMLESMYCSALRLEAKATEILKTIDPATPFYEYAYCYFLYAFAPHSYRNIVATRERTVQGAEQNSQRLMLLWSRLPLLMTDQLHAGAHQRAAEIAARYHDVTRYFAVPPNPCRHHRHLFYLAYRRGDLKDAYEHLYAGYRQAVNLGEAVATGWFALRLGQLNLRQGFYSEAAQHLYNAEAAWQGSERQGSAELARLQHYLAQLQHRAVPDKPAGFEARDLPVGDEHYFALDLEPARVYLLERHVAQALEFLQRQRAFLAGTTPEYHALLGLAYAGLDEREKAARELEQAHTLATTQSSLEQGWLPLARQLVAQGTLDQHEPAIKHALAFIHNHHLQGELDFLRALYPQLAEQQQKPPLQVSQAPQRFVRVLGTLAVEEAGREVSWKATKPKEMFGLLLVSYFKESGPGLAREAIMAALWPESSEAHAASSFRVTLQRLRAVLGTSAEIKRNAHGAYSLAGLHADIIFFLEAIENFDDEAALHWYGGEFLTGVGLNVVDYAEMRQRFTHLWRAATLRFAAYGEPQRVVNALSRLLEHDPLDIEAHQHMHRALQALGDAARLQQHINESRKRWLEEIGEIPSELADLLENRTP